MSNFITLTKEENNQKINININNINWIYVDCHNFTDNNDMYYWTEIQLINASVNVIETEEEIEKLIEVAESGLGPVSIDHFTKKIESLEHYIGNLEQSLKGCTCEFV